MGVETSAKRLGRVENKKQGCCCLNSSYQKNVDFGHLPKEREIKNVTPAKGEWRILNLVQLTL